MLRHPRPARGPQRDGTAAEPEIPAAEGTATQLTFDPGEDTFPTCPPEGIRIALTSDRSGDYDIWVISLPSVSGEQKSWSSIKSEYR